MSIMDGLQRGAGKRNGDRSGVSFADAMQQLRGNPAETIRAAGYEVPAEAAGDPKKAVMHMMRTGQIGGPLMKMVGPMIARMGGGK